MTTSLKKTMCHNNDFKYFAENVRKVKKKGLNYAEVSEIQEEEDEEEDTAEVARVTKKNVAPRSFSNGRFKPRRFTGKCFYCHEKNHRKISCWKRQDDEKKGIFRPCVPKPQAQASGIQKEAEVDAVKGYLNSYLA